MSRPMNILVVDDEPDIRHVVTYKLRKLGHEVAEFSNGEAALVFAFANPLDLVLLDVTMPDMSGIEVCEQLRGNDATKNVAVILMTAKSHAVDVKRGFHAGTDAYIIKPFTPKELVARIESMEISLSEVDV